MSRWTRNRRDSYMSYLDPRIILLFDMDCWEAQIHQRSKPDSIGKPCVVANPSGRIVAVSYEAKVLGINRESTPRVQDACDHYPDVIVIQIPERFPGRPNNRIAQAATDQIVDTIKEVLDRDFPPGSIFEYSSGDEFYVEVTAIVERYIRESRQVPKLWENSYIYTGSGENDIREIRNVVRKLECQRNLTENKEHELGLLHGAGIATYLVEQILEKTGYQSSVGIASNKLVAKISSGVKKPGSITICSRSGFEEFSKIIKMKNIPKLGGKHGEAIMERCRVRTMYGLQAVYLYEIANIPTDTGIIGSKYAEIYLKLANGFCSEVVKEKDHPDTVSVSQSVNRTFSFKELERTIGYLCTEMLDKLRRERDRHSREPSTLKLIIETDNGDWYFAFAIDRRNGICLPDLMTQLADNFWATNSKYWYPNGKVYKGSVTAKFN